MSCPYITSLVSGVTPNATENSSDNVDEYCIKIIVGLDIITTKLHVYFLRGNIVHPRITDLKKSGFS